MLYTETIDSITLAILKRLMSETFLNDFVLVGGTALALQIGHRKSVDLDLFTTEIFEPGIILDSLLPNYPIQPIQRTSLSLIAIIEGIKVDFIHFRYPFIRPIQTDEEIRMLSIEDIAPMKLDAISGRGSKKDFFDFYFLLRHFSLEKMFELYLEKYPHQTTFHVLKSLVYFIDAEKDPEPIVLDKTVTWANVKKEISEAIQKFN